MQTGEWKSELADILGEWDERQAAADAAATGSTTWSELYDAIDQLKEWMLAVPLPTSAKGRRRREELVMIIERLRGVLADI